MICVGKLKEHYYKEAQAEYIKMLRRFAHVGVLELPDQPLAHTHGKASEKAVLKTEGKRVLAKLKGFVIACDVGGAKFTFGSFALRLGDIIQQGGSTISFVVGGSLGLSSEVLAHADLRLSFSDMTMPHRLFRIVLLEQIFRCFKILHGERYHK